METLRMACSEAPDIVAALLSTNSGGLHAGPLADAVRSRSSLDQALRLGLEPLARVDALAGRAEEGAGVWGVDDWDLVVLSGYADIVETRTFDRAGFKAAMSRVIAVVKERLEAHLVLFNAATIDPGVNPHAFPPDGGDPYLVRAHKLNLALIELSYLHGVSIIDVDRVVAELGAADHVEGPLGYSATANDAIRQEFARVLEDIGFFERRPMLMQVGNPSQE